MESSAQRDAVGPSSPPRDPARVDLEGACILVVEDEVSLCDLLAEALTDLGCRVSTVGDGESALRAIQSELCIDMIVTDVGLPGLSGCEVARAAREARPNLPVLFMTGQFNPGEGDVFPDEIWSLFGMPPGSGRPQLAVGMEVIGKPFTLAALAARLQRMLSVRSGA